MNRIHINNKILTLLMCLFVICTSNFPVLSYTAASFEVYFNGGVVGNGGSVHYTGTAATIGIKIYDATSFYLTTSGAGTYDSIQLTADNGNYKEYQFTNPSGPIMLTITADDITLPIQTINFYHDTIIDPSTTLSYVSTKAMITKIDRIDVDPFIVDYDGYNNTGVDKDQVAKKFWALDYKTPGSYQLSGKLQITVFQNSELAGVYWADEESLYQYPWGSNLAAEISQRQQWQATEYIEPKGDIPPTYGTLTIRYKDNATHEIITSADITTDIDLSSGTVSRPATVKHDIVGYNGNPTNFMYWNGTDTDAYLQSKTPYSSEVTAELSATQPDATVYYFYDKKPPVNGRINIINMDVDTNLPITGNGYSKTLENVPLNELQTIKSTDLKSPENGAYQGANSTYTSAPLKASDRIQTDSQKITLTEGYKEAWVYFYYKITAPTPPPTPPPSNKLPVAVITAPDTVMAGDIFSVNGYKSYDKDGYIAVYVFDTPGSALSIESGKPTGYVQYNKVGEYEINLLVNDDKGAAGYTTKKITVTPPVPKAVIEVTGTLKQNRKFSFNDYSSDSPEAFPIVPEKTIWTITPITGGTESDIKYSGSLNGTAEKDCLIKKPGTYKITLSVTNTLGYTATDEKIIDIVPDYKPQANFYTNTAAYRDLNDGGYAAFNITDSSISSDDYISERLYEYCYDANNDGVFDEGWVTFSNANALSAALRTNQVGKYKIRLTVKEGFGQPTIPEFISPSDYLTATSDEIVVEVKNTAPVSTFSILTKKKLDVAVLTDFTGQKLSDLKSSLSTLKSDLYSKNVDVYFSVIDGSSSSVLVNRLHREIYSYSGAPIFKERVTSSENSDTTIYKGTNTNNNVCNTIVYNTPTEVDGLNNIVQTTRDTEGFKIYLNCFGEVFAKGKNNYGQLGIGSNLDSDVPVKVPGLNNIIQITSSSNFVLALSNNSIIYGWGALPDGMNYYKFRAPSNSPKVLENRSDWNGEESINRYAYVGLGKKNIYNYDGSFEGSVGFTITFRTFVDGFQSYTQNGTANIGQQYPKYNNVVDNTYPIYSVNQDAIRNIPLREDSDRQFIYVTESSGTNYEAGAGNYLSWSNLSKDIMNYLNDNSFSIDIVAPSSSYNVLSGKQEITLNNLVSNAANGGALYEQGQLQTALNDIEAKYSDSQELVQYVLVNEGVGYNINYSDYENDPKYSEKWKFNHADPNYFDNPLGTFTGSGTYVNTPFDALDKVGKYEITASQRDNPKDDTRFDNYRLWSDENLTKLILYVHRRPIAQFNIAFTGKDSSGNYLPTIADMSLDWDHTSRADRGIKAWEWSYKEIHSDSWTPGQPLTIPAGQTYLIRLRVQDLEGSWSYPFTRTVTATGIDLTPTVDADPPFYGWTNQDIGVTVTANDSGENDFNRVTYVTSPDTSEPYTTDGTMYQKVFPLTYTAEGSWYLHMRVFDNTGNTFYRFRGPYLIDKTPPGLTAAPYQADWTNQDVTVSLYPWDALSGVQKWRYIVSDNNSETWGEWTGYSWEPVPSTVTLDYEGMFVIVAEITDNAGNVAYVTTGSYLIDTTPPVITADNEGPVEAEGSITINLTLTDNLSGVKNTRYAFSQSPEKPDDGWIETDLTEINAVNTCEGVWYLHVESVDNAGNVSYRVLGSYEIINVRIYDLTVTLINDVIWRDYYFESTAFDGAGRPTEFERKEGIDIKAFQMPVNNYDGACVINYGQTGIDSGCEVSFYLRTIGNPDNLMVYVHYVTAEGEQTAVVEPVSCENQLWTYTFIVPLECITGTYISFDAEAVKNGVSYGTEYWTEPWLPLNTDRNVFYISGNAVDRLKFNQSH